MTDLRYLSLFAGMEAAHLALAPLGWECVGVAEIDPAACAVLRHRLPTTPNLGSVTEITDQRIAALGRIDVVIGGSPCQDLSVAGKRVGLAGARSGLFHEQVRIFDAARSFCGARWLAWENVPGALSSNEGRDFAVVVGALAGCDLDVPADGWGSEGVALGEHGLVEWAVLDAQWFGVAQRRRRVFAVLDTGNWSGRSPVLLEPESLRGDSAPRREAGEVVTGAIMPRAGSSSGPGMQAESDGGTSLILSAVMAHGQGGAEISGGVHCPTLTCNHEAPVIAFSPQAGGKQTTLGYSPMSCTAPTLSCTQQPAIAGTEVRRLTPRECERLQGASDDWTLVPDAKGKPMADGPRYKMLGNSFAVPVIRWIGRQIALAHAESLAEAA